MTEVSLKEHLEAQIKWVDRYFERQVSVIHDSTEKAAAQIDKRLLGMNEFRDTLRDQAGRLATKDEVRVIEKGTDARLKLLELRDARIAGMAAIVALIVSGATAIVTRLL